jgi:acylphosphatase
MRSVHVMIAGRVQGVGFRAFVEREARARGLRGWVRNLADGRVEAVLQGAERDVDYVVKSCRRGPPSAEVRSVTVDDHSAPSSEHFLVLPTRG